MYNPLNGLSIGCKQSQHKTKVSACGGNPHSQWCLFMNKSAKVRFEFPDRGPLGDDSDSTGTFDHSSFQDHRPESKAKGL